MSFADDGLLPKPPTFSDELVEQCTQSRDFRPILFEWYKFVGIFCNVVACISPDSPALRDIPPVHYAVLIGLLNRCSRLMLSNVRLSSTRKYGETTSLLDRSISESAIKIQWLCHKNSTESFVRYLADGLKKDLILKKQIERNIESRNGDILVIEQRMLNSINKCIELSRLSEQEINDAKRLPDFASMCNDLDFGDLFYTAIQRMGSHAVHGTWSELVFNYLRLENGQRLCPRDHEIDTQDVQFIVVIQLVLQAMKSFLKCVTSDVSDIAEFISTIESISNEIVEIQDLAWEADFGTSR
jgi:hypothetical protein